MLAVYENLLAALRVLGSGVAPAHQALGARGEQFKSGEVFIQNGQFVNLLRIERRRHVCAVCLELRGIAGNFHNFRGAADFELPIHAGVGIRVNNDVFDLKRLESRAFHLQGIGVGHQVRDAIVAVVVGGRCFARAFAHVGRCDFGSGNSSARRIGDCAANGAVNSLGKRRCGGERGQSNANCNYRCEEIAPRHIHLTSGGFLGHQGVEL